MLHRLEAQGAQPTTEQLDLFTTPVEEQAEATNPTLTDDEADVLDEIKDMYLADKTPLEVMQLVAQWQNELKDKKKD